MAIIEERGQVILRSNHVYFMVFNNGELYGTVCWDAVAHVLWKLFTL